MSCDFPFRTIETYRPARYIRNSKLNIQNFFSSRCLRVSVVKPTASSHSVNWTPGSPAKTRKFAPAPAHLFLRTGKDTGKVFVCASNPQYSARNSQIPPKAEERNRKRTGKLWISASDLRQYCPSISLAKRFKKLSGKEQESSRRWAVFHRRIVDRNAPSWNHGMSIPGIEHGFAHILQTQDLRCQALQADCESTVRRHSQIEGPQMMFEAFGVLAALG